MSFQVVCSLATQAPWYILQHFTDTALLHGRDQKPIFYHQVHPVLVSYLDADKDGQVSIHEFYDIKIVNLLRRIFDGLDANNDGTVDMSEASLTSLLRPAFFRSVTEELFDLADVNNDNLLSMEDFPPMDLSPSGLVYTVCLNTKPISQCLTKLNKTEEICWEIVLRNFWRMGDHIYNVSYGRRRKRSMDAEDRPDVLDDGDGEPEEVYEEYGEDYGEVYFDTTENLTCKTLMSTYLTLVDRQECYFLK